MFWVAVPRLSALIAAEGSTVDEPSVPVPESTAPPPGAAIRPAGRFCPITKVRLLSTRSPAS